MYICLDCQRTFSEAAEWEETHGLDYGPYEQWSGCPYCNGSYVETYQCDCCEEWIEDTYIKTDDGHRYCFNCYQVTHIEHEE